VKFFGESEKSPLARGFFSLELLRDLFHSFNLLEQFLLLFTLKRKKTLMNMHDDTQMNPPADEPMPEEGMPAEEPKEEGAEPAAEGEEAPM